MGGFEQPRVSHNGGVRPCLGYFAFAGDGATSTITFKLIVHGVCYGLYTAAVTVTPVAAKTMIETLATIAASSGSPTLGASSWTEDMVGIEITNVAGANLLYNESVEPVNNKILVTPTTAGSKIPTGAYPTGVKLGWVG